MSRHRRTRHNALAPINAPTWLVMRDVHNRALEWTELAPLVDPAVVLAEAIERLEGDGWECEEPPSQRFAGCFCRRADGTRIYLGVAQHNPAEPTPMDRPPSDAAWSATVSELRPRRE